MDIGNTLVKIGVFNINEKLKVYRFPTTSFQTRDFTLFLETIVKEFPALEKGILCSVVGYENIFLENFKFLKNFIVLSHQTPVRFLNDYLSPQSLGLDRLAAVSGSLVHYSSENCLIISAGTCITYDFINHESMYLGGAISPGLGLRSKSLHTFTDKLPLIDFINISKPEFMGKTTTECIQSGILWGLIHEVNGFIGQYLINFPDLRIILAGGDANFLDTHLKNTIFGHQINWMPDLVLIGLNRILNIQDA